ncbi:MAG: hypothetical protein EHM28_15080, partial [Spirochaetaceae bacterium]
MPEKDKSDHPYTIIRGWGPPKEPPAQPPKESSFQQPKKSQETVFASAQPTEEPKQEKARVIPILLLLLGVLAAAVMVFFLFIFKPQVQTQVTSSVPTAAMDTLGKTDNVALTQKIIQTVKENSPVYF